MHPHVEAGPAPLAVHLSRSGEAAEIYLTAVPTSGESARELFGLVAEELRRQGAWICQERIFAPVDMLPELEEQRREAYRRLGPTPEPAWLASRDEPGAFPGVQVYAVRTPRPPQMLKAGSAQARLFESGGRRWMASSGITAAQADGGAQQARSTFLTAETLLKTAGADLRSVARTWFFIDHILDWYGEFNRARTGLFVERGLLGGAKPILPASTGIGVSPARGARCSLDFYAALGPDADLRRLEAAGKQRSANNYGSAFARAAVLPTPAGRTVFLSGTAAIDTSGATMHLGNRAAQIETTIENARAVFAQFGAGDAEVVQACAYCADEEARQIFRGEWAHRCDWPWVTMIGDVCRADLLFEVEAVALIPGSDR